MIIISFETFLFCSSRGVSHIIYKFINLKYFHTLRLDSVLNVSIMTLENRDPWSKILLDKVVFITGAGGGIGSAIVRTAALQGARVVVSDINKAASDKVVEAMISDDDNLKDRLISLQLDTVSEEAIQQAVKHVVDVWGTVDVLVNA